MPQFFQTHEHNNPNHEKIEADREAKRDELRKEAAAKSQKAAAPAEAQPQAD